MTSKDLVSFDQGLVEDEDSEMGIAPPAALLRPISDARVTVDSVVGGHNIGETAAVSSTAYAVVSSYLLSWKLLLSLFSCSSSEQRVHYAVYLRRTSLLDQLLTDVFRLLPASPVVPLSDALLSLPSSNKVGFCDTYCTCM